MIHPTIRKGPARLLLLAALLGGLSVAVAQSTARRPEAPPAHPACLFLSPNIEDGLSLAESLRRLDSRDQAQSRELAHSILQRLGVPGGEVHNALGEWSEGVENSLLVVVPDAIDIRTLRCAAAWFG